MTTDALARPARLRLPPPGAPEQALTHRSFGADNNERLEFVGDAVLNCAIAAILYRAVPATYRRASFRACARVSSIGETLARLGALLDLGSAIRLGEGEQRERGRRAPIDSCRRARGTVWRDFSRCRVRRRVRRRRVGLRADLAKLDPAALSKDPKTRLQEWLQARKIAVPEYSVTAVTGEAHAQTFTVECRIPALGIAAIGTGTSRRAAEQAAATAGYCEGNRRGKSRDA